MKLILIFVHLTATVSPSTIPSGPTNPVDPTSNTVVAVAVAVPAATVMFITGITTLRSYIYYVHSYIIHLLTALGYVCQLITALCMHIFLPTTVTVFVVVLVKLKGKKSTTRATVTVCSNILQ